MRLALAGFGGSAQRGHLPAIRHLAAHGRLTIAGVCDADPAQRRKSELLLPQVATFDDAEAMLDVTMPDLLVIATDPTAHMTLIAAALSRQCHVLCEKPVVTNAADLEALHRLGHQPQGLLAAVHQYRHSTGWGHLVDWTRQSSAQPFRLTVLVERPGTDPHASSQWRSDPRSGGGLADHAVHYLALARDLYTEMTVTSADRAHDERGNERVRGRVELGPNSLEIEVAYGAATRRTTITVTAGERWLSWSDNDMRWTSGKNVHRRTVPALSNRKHIDDLYLALYRELLAQHANRVWCRDRLQEVLDVSRTLIDLGRTTDRHTAAGDRPG